MLDAAPAQRVSTDRVPERDRDGSRERSVGLGPETALDEQRATAGGGALEFDRLMVYCVALASVAAGILHGSVAVEHARAGMPWFTGLFILAAEFQFLWAVLVRWRSSGRWLAIGVVANMVMVLLWAMSRTSGLPLIPGAQTVEPLGLKDVITVALELTVIGGAAIMAIVPLARRRRLLPAGRMAFEIVLAAVAVATALALAVPARSVDGHRRRSIGEEPLGQTEAHHPGCNTAGDPDSLSRTRGASGGVTDC